LKEDKNKSELKNLKPSYTPKDIMDNLAWQWRDHHDDIFKSLLLTKDPGFKVIYDHQSHNPSVQGMYGLCPRQRLKFIFRVSRIMCLP
jgi:hypothetical protein